MKLMPIAATLAMLALPLHGNAAEERIAVFAAQNFYGEVATTIGGDRVAVATANIPADVDPHDFEPTPSLARLVADARIVVFNGADYDHWMEHLLEATERPERIAIEAAALTGVEGGDNPHVWYDPRTMPAVATAIAKALAAADPERAAAYEERHQAFVAGLGEVEAQIATIRKRFAGTLVTATEPVFGPMAAALDLDMTNEAFQRSVMNETEPSARQIAGVIDDLKNRRVKALIYNQQVSDALTEQLLDIAEEANIPTVPVTETVPDGTTYADWMLGQLKALEKALAGTSS